MTTFLVIAGIVVALYLYASSNTSKSVGSGGTSTSNKDELFARIRGPNLYAVDVVGESFHRQNFERLTGSHAYTDLEVKSDAFLHLEDNNPHDTMAVSVTIDGLVVGHLSREDARDFRESLRMSGLFGRNKYAVGARLYCGGEEGLFSVRVDLPSS